MKVLVACECSGAVRDARPDLVIIDSGNKMAIRSDHIRTDMGLKSMAVEYDCEGCGVHVYAVSLDVPPRHQFCATCAWGCEYIPDPIAFEKWRIHMDGINPDKPKPVPRGGFRR